MIVNFHFQFTKQWIRDMTSDFSYLGGDTNILAILIAGVSLGFSMVSIVLQYQEWNKTLYLAKYAHLYLNGRLKYSEILFPDNIFHKLSIWYFNIVLYIAKKNSTNLPFSYVF